MPQRDPMEMLIVRSGLSEEYYAFLKVFAATRGLDVVVDRRLGERRQGAERVQQDRRRTERRGPTPDTWLFADFITCKRKR